MVSSTPVQRREEKAEHPPGPWKVRPSEGGGEKYWHIDGPRRERIAVTKSKPVAHLISAAPDLLEACKAAMDCLTDAKADLSHRGFPGVVRTKLANAIAKAGGGL